MGASPGAAVALTKMNAEVDVRDVLPDIRVPSLIIHRTGDRLLKIEEGRYLAERIPGARFHEIDSPYGHLATFSLSQQDVKAVDHVLADLLAG